MPYIYYCGNLTQAKALFRGFPINTDDKPLVEYLAADAVIGRHAPGVTWLTSLELAAFYESLFAAAPPDRDPFLRDASDGERRAALAGLSYFKFRAFREAGLREESARAYGEYVGHLKPLG